FFTIWGGANDLLVAQQANPAIPAGNIASEITTLAMAGAKQFLVANLPLIGELPLTNSMAPLVRQSRGQWALRYNGILKAEVDQLQPALGVHIHLLDIQSLVQNAMANPSQYGFTNVTGSAINSSLAGNGYLFWDLEHPTTQAHEDIGNLAFQSVP